MDLDSQSVRNCTIGQLRKQLGIDKEVLYATYEEERRCIPNTPWSHRLPARPIPSQNS